MTTKPTDKRSRFEADPIPRRDFLGLSALGAAAAALFFSLFGMLRLPKAAVLSSPSKKFDVTLPDTLANDEAYVPEGRPVALFKDDSGVFAISTTCTHLGCIVKPTAKGFECPCHGSRFAKDGSVTRGPAPKALPWLKVTESNDGFQVDEEVQVAPGTKV